MLAGAMRYRLSIALMLALPLSLLSAWPGAAAGEGDTHRHPDGGIGDAAVGGNNVAAAVWEQTANFSSPGLAWVSVYTGSWSTPAAVGFTDIGTSGPKIAVDENGWVTAVWTSGQNGVRATRNTGAGRTFLQEQALTGMVGGSGQIEVVGHDSGDFVVVWQEVEDVRAMRCR